MSIKDYLLNEVGPINRAVEKLVKDIQDLTDDNAHTEALLVLAKFLKAKELEKVFLGIQSIHNAIGSMPSTLGKFRDEMGEQLMKYAKSKLEKSDFDKVQGAY